MVRRIYFPLCDLIHFWQRIYAYCIIRAFNFVFVSMWCIVSSAVEHISPSIRLEERSSVLIVSRLYMCHMDLATDCRVRCFISLNGKTAISWCSMNMFFWLFHRISNIFLCPSFIYLSFHFACYYFHSLQFRSIHLATSFYWQKNRVVANHFSRERVRVGFLFCK